MQMMLGDVFVEIFELFKKSLEVEIVDTILLLVHVNTQEVHLVRSTINQTVSFEYMERFEAVVQ